MPECRQQRMKHNGDTQTEIQQRAAFPFELSYVDESGQASGPGGVRCTLFFHGYGVPFRTDIPDHGRYSRVVSGQWPDAQTAVGACPVTVSQVQQ